MSQSTTIIDDRDLTGVTYTGTWVVGGTVHEHDGTVSSSVNVGDHFSVAFTGSTIAVYGTYDASSAGVVTSYAIDGGAAATVTSTSSPLDSFQQLFWQSTTVPNGAHDLVVTMNTINPGTDGEGTVWFDYFNVTADAAIPVSPSPSSSSTSSTPSITSTSLITTSTLSSTATSSANSLKDSSTASSAAASSSSSGVSTTLVTKKSSHAGVIGGVIGAVGAIALIIGALFFYRKHRTTSQYASAPAGPNMSVPFNGLTPTQPFLQPTPTMNGRIPPPSAAYSPYNPGGFDASATYATAGAAVYGHTGQVYSSPQGPPQGAYDLFASVGPTTALQQQLNQDPAVPQPRSSYAPTESASSVPSSSQYVYPQHRGGGPLSLVGGAPLDTNDSVTELKRRQQQVVNTYKQGVGSASAAPPLIQHMDSGVRALNPATATAIELPPTYTPN